LSTVYVFFPNLSIKKFIIDGIPQTIVWLFNFYSIYSCLRWQLVYFYLICYYLKSRLSSVNERMVSKSNHGMKDFRLNFIEIIRNLNSIYLEISDYDKNYWSLFLFMIWISFATIMSRILYMTFFVDSNLIIKMIFIYGSLLFVCILMSIISTASLANFETNKSLKLLYSCLNKFGKRNLSNRSRIMVFGENSSLLKQMY
jgi:hypothetical protein